MEQVIKFRGQRIDNKEWIYGCCGYGFTQKIEYIMPSMYFATRDFGEQDDRGNPIIEDEIAIGGFIPVIPESVGQFTGLTDKHGKEIYCGDKLQKIYEDKCEEGGFGKTIVDVAFKDGAFGWIGEITGNFHPFAVEPFEDSEIIGNIHQNSK